MYICFMDLFSRKSITFTITSVVAFAVGLIFIFSFYENDVTYYIGLGIISIVLAVALWMAVLKNIPSWLFGKNGGLFLIRKGRNFSGFWFLKMFLKKQKPFKVRATLWYNCEIPTLGIQKLFGVGNLFNHHKESDRFAFKYEGNNEYGIYTYRYENGKKVPDVRLGTVSSGENFYLAFSKKTLDKYEKGRYLYPYFEQDGQDEKGAPHKMSIALYFYPEDFKPIVETQTFEI